MALLAMAVYDTKENGRTWMTARTFGALRDTVDWDRHRLIVVDNGSCDETKAVIHNAMAGIPGMERVGWAFNAGQARAISYAWDFAKPGEHVARIDNDVFIKTPGWLDKLEACVERDQKLGIVGLKHRDLMDHPDGIDGPKTTLCMLPHKRGESWLVVERLPHVLGSAQLVNAALFAKIGSLRQYGKWGYEDSDYAVRCELAGFYSAYFHGAEFEDLDADKRTDYQEWKNSCAASWGQAHASNVAEYRRGGSLFYKYAKVGDIP